MDSPWMQCPKCDGQMEQGFVLDHTQGGRLVSSWSAGAPEKSFWLATKEPKPGGIPIGVFRCGTCGYLESYARDEFAAK